MNYLNKVKVGYVATALIFCGCMSKKADDIKYETVHYNVVIAPDLSNRVDNRLYNKPVDDSVIVNALIDNIPVLLKNNGRETFQRDKFRVDFVNRKLINTYNVDAKKMLIDFAIFGRDQQKRIDYVNGNGMHSLAKDAKILKSVFSRIENLARSQTYGADIWSYFNDQIDANVVDLKEDVMEYDNTKYTNKYKNVMVMLTDGYIEAGLDGEKACQGNRCYYLSSKRIQEFRAAFLKSGEPNIEKFFIDNDYGLVPVNNKYLKDLEVLVLELYDRSLSKGGSATVIPKDKEIIELFWKDWLVKSGVKRFELHFTASSQNEVHDVLSRFLSVK
jgi:hypothetical protein